MDADTPLFSGRYHWRQSDSFEAVRVTYRRKLLPKLMNGLVGLIFGGLFVLMLVSPEAPVPVKVASLIGFVPIVLASLSDRFWPLLGFGLRSSPDAAELVLTPAALKIRTVSYAESVPWADYASAAETPDSFVIFLDKKRHSLLPKRAFAPAQIPPLRAFLRERFGAAAELMQS